MKKLVVSVVLVNLLVACSTQKPKEEPVVVEPEVSVEAPAPIEPEVAAPAPVAAVEVDPLNDPNSILSNRSVYYPFDVSAVQDSDKPVVAAHGQYLAGHPHQAVRVEGNADERGSTEYNLALGQRRANGVKKMLVLGGANSSQIQTASYGEERPNATGHNEASWSKNRRSDIKY